MAEPRVFIGLDAGAKRIGVATGNDLARLASPLTIIPVDGQEIPAIAKLVAAHSAVGIVVGLPRGLDGQDTEQTELTRRFGQRLSNLGVELYWQDEAATSLQAAAESGSRAKYVDDQAAAIILQDFFDNL